MTDGVAWRSSMPVNSGRGGRPGSLGYDAPPMVEISSHSADNIENQLEFETLISDTSAALMAAAPEQIDRAVEGALDRVREFFRADRCALLSVGADQRLVNVRLASYASGVSHVPSDINLAELFPWSGRKTLVERVPVRVSSLADLPPEASAERPNWEAMRIRSCLLLPIETGTDVRHLIVIHTVHEEREWPGALTKRLRLLGELLVGALERKEMIAGLREAEARVRRNEARLASGAALAGLAFYEVDLGERVTYVDDRLRDICGVPGERDQGLKALDHWLAHLHPDDRHRVLEMRRQLHEGSSDEISLEYRFLHPVKGQLWIHHLARVARRDATGRAIATYGVLRDITTRRRAEDELADLSRHLIRAQEEERAMIARELHDDVTQRLAVLAIDAGRAELSATTGVQAEAMRTLREELVRVSEDVHSLAYQLHSSVLEDLGLVEALRTACEHLGRRSRVEVSLDLDSKADALRGDAALCLFRVAQEALNNLARHSEGRLASVSLRRMDGGVLLAVRDDGIGFDPAGPGTRKTLGLASMRERVRLVNGTLDIESAPGHGTAIVAWVPAQEASP